MNSSELQVRPLLRCKKEGGLRSSQVTYCTTNQPLKCPELETKMKRPSLQLHFVYKITATEATAHFIIQYPFYEMCEKDLSKFCTKKVKTIDTPLQQLFFFNIRPRDPSHFPFWLGFQEANNPILYLIIIVILILWISISPHLFLALDFSL